MTEFYNSPAIVTLSRHISASYARLTEKCLISHLSKKPITDTAQESKLMYNAPSTLLFHSTRGRSNTSQEPIFLYANKEAQRVFGYSLQEFIGMESRLSAPSTSRSEREAFLKKATSGIADGYKGTRIRKDGSLFEIDAVLWAVVDDAGVVIGQAATF